MVTRYTYVTCFFIIIIHLFIDKAIKQQESNVTVY